MAKTIRDLFKGSDWDSKVNKETETFLEEELSGIRIKSLVDINNPLIYGNEATRIALRSTPMLDDMKAATHSKNDGGLIGGRIINLRNKVNGILGIPEVMIPTRVVELMGTEITAQEVIDGKNGTDIGKLLKESGGNPKTIATQVIGGAVNLAKDKLRGVLFGTQNEEETEKSTSTYTDKITYTDVKSSNIGNTTSYTEIQTKDELLLDRWEASRVNLANYSPIYGVDRKSDLWNTKLGEQVRDDEGSPLSKFSSGLPYTGIVGDVPNAQNEFAITNRKRGIGYRDSETGFFADVLNEQDALIPNADSEKFEDMDLVPFWVGFVGGSSKTHFRALLSGISETVTPSWNDSNFFGNPFSYKTYSTISRSVTFTLQIYCMSKVELEKNWDRVEQLTKYTYPRFETVKSGETETELIKPPIIKFRIGDVYVDKIGVIDSLSYTFPDNGTWEIDKGKILPKFIDISISISFIEQPDIIANGLYGKGKKEAETFSSETKTKPENPPSTNSVEQNAQPELPDITRPTIFSL